MLLEQLREKMNKANAAMRAMLDANPQGLNEEQSAQYDKLEEEFDTTRAQLSKALERQEKEQERNTFMSEQQRKPMVEKVHSNDSENMDNDAQSYRTAFWAAQTRKALTAEQTRALSTGVSDKGGYLVPEEFQTTIIQKLTEKSYLRNLATVSTSRSTENIPVEGDDGANSWVDEAGTYAESDPTIGQVIMKAHKTGRIIKVTDEILNDSFTSIEGYVSMKFAKSTIKAEEAAFVSGDGSGKPTGFLVTAEVGKVAASATAITGDEIIDLWGALDEDYAATGTWMMNRNSLIKLMKLKDSNGDYLVTKGLNGEPKTLLGRPIVINKHMPDIAASAKAIAFGDFSYYFIKDRTTMSMKRMDELYATTGHVGFRIDKRVDGKLVLPEAIQVLQMASA